MVGPRSLRTWGPRVPVKMSRRDFCLPAGDRIPGKGSPLSCVATRILGQDPESIKDHSGRVVPGDSLLLEGSSSWCRPHIRLHSLSTCSPGTLTVKHLIPCPSPLSSWRPHPSPQPAGHLSTGRVGLLPSGSFQSEKPASSYYYTNPFAHLQETCRLLLLRG